VDRGYIMYDKAGAPVRMIGAMTDITERKQAEQALREREARIRRLVDSNIIGIFFFELGGYISDANDAFLGIVGYTRDDMLTQKLSWTTITPPEYTQADQRAIDEALRTGSCTPYEKEYIRKDGQHVPVLMGGALLEGSQEQAVGFVLDLTERKRAEERIRHMAHHDALTGLPNRLLFHDRVDQAIAQSHRNNTQVAVLFIDLDHFKDINDSLGHLAGDHLLRATARRLQGCLREGDSVARLGGDEFVIGLPALTSSGDAILIASKILAGLRQPFELEQHELHVSGSIGISIYPADGENAEALMRTADTAMYHAKERGRDNYQFFTQQLNDAAQRRLTIANRMHRALERGEFTLHYQPQLDLKRERISSVEALIRWHQPAGDLAACSEFIKIAEDTGLIVPLGEWVLREACGQLRHWREAGYPELRVAVNLSPHQFRRPGFADLVAGILQESGLAGTALEMEITEGVLMIQSPENLKILEQLTDMGVGLAVDDFGTGYSSLSYLQRFPIQTLKIDQSFVDGIGEDANDTAIVSAIIAMADSLHLRVVAEGVETADQESFLKTHGCFMAQG
ncbi:MAG TPA: EAL domain-containing protein, partial [Burkholderiales bacterium]|nr:EAL domain-containing protein [Burkholderiales bacterium]